MKIYTTAQARETLLRRQPLDLQETSPKLLESIRELFGEALTPAQAVSVILKDVRTRGDTAVVDWNTRLDNNPNPVFRVSREQLQEALQNLPARQLEALQAAAGRVEQFHRKQPAGSWVDQSMGGTLGQLLRPIRRVGLSMSP